MGMAGEQLERFLPAKALKGGFRVIAADDQTVLEVVHVEVHTTRELLHIEAGEAILTVTASHRIVVPSVEGGEGAFKDVIADTLEAGDSIICKAKGGQRVVQKVTSVCVLVADRAGEAKDVFEITFKPDEPVAVIQPPDSAPLSKGFKKVVRRGRHEGRRRIET